MGLFRKRPVPTPDTTTTILLAGGRSERFGSTKALVQLQGRPLVRWAAGLAAAVSARSLLTVPPGADEKTWRRAIGQTIPIPGADGGSLDVVRDDEAFTGPLGGIEAALPEVRTPFVLLLAVDMPLLRPDLLLGLNERLVGHDAVAYHLDGWWRPMPSLWRKDALQRAIEQTRAEGDRSLHALFDRVDARPLGPEFLALFDADTGTLSSVNTREDLEAVARRLEGQA